LNLETLNVASDMIRRCGINGTSGHLVYELAEDFVDSFEAMRVYLREASQNMQQVDPELQKNKGLVERLEDLDAAWLLFTRYAEDRGMRVALKHSCRSINAAQDCVPGFTRMCLDCDPEFFMVLPRVVWLGFLKTPSQDKLLQGFLPHHFRHNGTEEGSPNLDRFVEQYRRVMQLLVYAQPQRDGKENQEVQEPQDVACQILVHRAVVGTSFDYGGINDGLVSTRHAEVKNAVEDFMRELEAWSMELQRHCPKDWNCCSEMLVQWSGGVLKKNRPLTFCV